MILTVNQYFEGQSRQNKPVQSINIQYADVYAIASDGEPILIFPTETLPSKKADYRRMKHYVPQVGDRVMLINNVIIGGWKV